MLNLEHCVFLERCLIKTSFIFFSSNPEKEGGTIDRNERPNRRNFRLAISPRHENVLMAI